MADEKDDWKEAAASSEPESSITHDEGISSENTTEIDKEETSNDNVGTAVTPSTNDNNNNTPKVSEDCAANNRQPDNSMADEGEFPVNNTSKTSERGNESSTSDGSTSNSNTDFQTASVPSVSPPNSTTTTTTTSRTPPPSSTLEPTSEASSKNTPLNDSDSIKIKFLFANRDGLHVIVQCKLSDSVGEIKGVLLSMWPDDLSPCYEGDRIRLICMGKGILMPDGKSLRDCEIPKFKTHATPINVSVKPDYMVSSSSTKKSLLDGACAGSAASDAVGSNGSSSRNGGNGVSQGDRKSVV